MPYRHVGQGDALAADAGQHGGWKGSLLFVALVKLLIDAGHITEERAHLFGTEPGATGFECHLDAIRHDEMAPDLDRAGAPRVGGSGLGVGCLSTSPIRSRDRPSRLPLANQQELLEVALV